MKRFPILVLSLLLALSFTGTVSAGEAAETYYYHFAEFETADINGMNTIVWEDASGGKVVFADNAKGNPDKSKNNVRFSFDVPADGIYAVWVRMYIKTTHQCTFFYNPDSAIYADQIFKMLGDAAAPLYLWVPLDARPGVNDDPVATKTAEMKAGTNVISLGVRSLANVVDDNWASEIGNSEVKTTHYFDCILVTDNLDFDPYADDWAAVRDDLAAGGTGNIKPCIFPDAWKSDNDGHWKECTDCGKRGESDTHKYAPCGEECSVCGYRREVTHRYDEYVQSAGGHQQVCRRCGESSALEAHADADADNKCDVCGYKMTAVSDTEDDTVDSEKTTGADKGTAADKGGLYAGAVIGIAAVAVIAVVIGMVIRKKKA